MIPAPRTNFYYTRLCFSGMIVLWREKLNHAR